MLSNEYDFVDSLKEQGHSWNYITKKFNDVYSGNVKPATLSKRYARETAYRESVGGSLVDKAVSIVKSEPIKPTELARRLSLDMEGLESLLDDLFNSRSAIKFHNNALIFDRSYSTPDNMMTKIAESLESGKWYRLGILSDPHLCSIHEQIPLFSSLTNIFEEKECDAIINAGDVTSGIGTVYKGQYQELKITGVDKQLQYATSVYPESSIPTYMVSGNHDLDAFKTAGVDIIEKLCEKRDDLNYLGKLGGWLDMGGIEIYVVHPDGGVPYARTYKMQKIVDNMGKKPHIAIFGHWHIMAYLPYYSGTICVSPGCLEAQSDYLVRKGLVPELGGVILSFMVSDIDGVKTIVRQEIEFINMSNYVS